MSRNSNTLRKSRTRLVFSSDGRARPPHLHRSLRSFRCLFFGSGVSERAGPKSWPRRPPLSSSHPLLLGFGQQQQQHNRRFPNDVSLILCLVRSFVLRRLFWRQLRRFWSGFWNWHCNCSMLCMQIGTELGNITRFKSGFKKLQWRIGVADRA